MRRETWISAAVFFVMAAGMLALATGCTWAIAHGASAAWRIPFRVVCHGIPNRCLTMWGAPMPICARCTAIYVGLGSGILLFFFVPSIPERLLRIAAGAAVIPMVIDGLTQAVQLRESTNSLRLATGFVAALFFSMWVMSAIERRHERVSAQS